ncbi:MAG: hypothetical protein MJ182_09770, partial [Treponema sp.]|nr:hypothetical protein [Treponema sp.]
QPASEPSSPTTPTQPATEPSSPTTPEQPASEPSSPTTPTQPATEPSSPTTPTQPATEPSNPTTPEEIPEVKLNRLEIPAGYAYTDAGTKDSSTFDGYLVKLENTLDKSKVAAGKKYKITINGKALTNLTIKKVGTASNPQLNIQIVDIAPEVNYWNTLGETMCDLVPDTNGNISISTTIDITKNLCESATTVMLFIKINQDDNTKQDYFKNGKYIIGATADETLPTASNDVNPVTPSPTNQPLYDVDFTKLNGETITKGFDFVNYDSVSGEKKGSISSEGLILNVNESWDGAFKIAVTPLDLSQVKKIVVEYKVSNDWTWVNENNKFNVMLVSKEDSSYKATEVDLADFGTGATNTDFQIEELTNIYPKNWEAGITGADKSKIIAIKIDSKSGKGTVTIKYIKFFTE